MGNLDITMEEYIRLKEEKDQSRGQNLNWETAAYCKVNYFDDVNYFKAFKAELPTIVFNDTLMSELEVPSEPTEYLYLLVPTGRYVVPTGRVIATDSVIVATSGYVVPAAYDISPGRVK
ncbi:hypothetical protein Tco_0958183 [Tanacetum coccineum]